MSEKELKLLYEAGADKVENLMAEVCNALIGKGLSFRQAELLLERAKDLLKNAKI